MTGLEILKTLTTSQKYKGMVFIKSPYLKEPQVLSGYYLTSSEEHSGYFYGPDRIGFNFRAHYNSLVVKDYRGIYRRIVSKISDGYEIRIDRSETGSIYPSSIDQASYIMPIAPGDWKPGDLFMEADDSPRNYEVLLSIYHDPSTKELMVFTLLTDHGDTELRTFKSAEELDGQIYTLIPFSLVTE